MTFEFISAKNSEKTVKINNNFLHSAYNPSAEASTFVKTINLTFCPQNIVIIEPGLGYCLPFLKSEFPNTKIGCIKLCPQVQEINNFDFKIDFLSHKENFKQYLFSFFKYDEFFNSIFITLPSSSKIFKEENIKVWNAIKECTEEAKTILITSEFFEKKWLRNTFNEIKFLKKIVFLKKQIDLPVVICASGPSLKPNLLTIQNNQKKFFIICLSSAYSVLRKNNIEPDLIFTTDGGFWAGEHIKKIKNSILAMPFEANCPKNILQNNVILPLKYNDGLSSEIIEETGIKFIECERNGTVSGSALCFALQHSSKNIYFFGLDLSEQSGFQHTQPNELEYNAAYKDNKLHTKETRLFPSSLKSSSLEIYKNWFSNQKFPENRVYRVINNKKNNLNTIQDIKDSDFENICNKIKNTKTNSKDFFTSPQDFNVSEKQKQKIFTILKCKLDNKTIKQQLFPLSYILLSHLQPESIEYNKKKQEIDSEIKKLLDNFKNE